MPRIFAKVDGRQGQPAREHPRHGYRVRAEVAFLVSFNTLWDVVGLGVLLSFDTTNACSVNARLGVAARSDGPVMLLAHTSKYMAA
jgi:hypothetical protein